MDKYKNFNMDNALYIDGNNDPFGINEVMIKMVELLDERYDLLSESDADATILVDFTTLSDEEMGELIREAVACVEFENEVLDCNWSRATDTSLLS